jgi:hypothetical protein
MNDRSDGTIRRVFPSSVSSVSSVLSREARSRAVLKTPSRLTRYSAARPAKAQGGHHHETTIQAALVIPLALLVIVVVKARPSSAGLSSCDSGTISGTGCACPSSPCLSVSQRPYGVAGRSSSDAWAVGNQPPDALIMHWDGTCWTVASSTPNGYLRDTSAVCGAGGLLPGMRALAVFPGAVMPPSARLSPGCGDLARISDKFCPIDPGSGIANQG